MTLAPDIVAWASRFDSGTLSDALDAMGLPPGVGGLRPLWPAPRICGPARTVQLAPASSAVTEDEGQPKRHLGAAAVDDGEAGDVVVVANDGRVEAGAWGGLLSLGASVKGLAGAVVDGACRDAAEAEDLAFPVFARAATPRTARGRVVEVSTGAPVTVAGLVVRAGDLVVADESGVVCLPLEQVEEVLARADRIGAREAEMARRLRTGAGTAEVLGATYEDLLAGGGPGR